MLDDKSLEVGDSNSMQLSVEERIAGIKKNQEVVRKLMASVLRENEHYGIIPGTKKPTLLKSGAEIMAFTFQLDPKFETEFRDLGNGHREVVSNCTLYSAVTGKRLGMASGSCSTLESKYRYRTDMSAWEETGEPIPKDAKENKAKYRKQGFGMQRLANNSWAWVKYKESVKVENPDIADVWNTVLKMSQKRAFTAVILLVLAVSDMFTQDNEDVQSLEEEVVDYGNEGETLNKSTGEIIPSNKQSDPQSEKLRVEQYNWLVEKLNSLLRDRLKTKAQKLVEHSTLQLKWNNTKESMNGYYPKGQDILDKALEEINSGK